MYNKDSVTVKAWVRLVQSGTYTLEQVPQLGNLRDAVAEALAAAE